MIIRKEKGKVKKKTNITLVKPKYRDEMVLNNQAMTNASTNPNYFHQDFIF